MREKTVFYCKIDNSFIQIEEMMFPELKKFPLVIKRHDQIIGKNNMASQYGIEVGDSLDMAYKKCLNLVAIEPHDEDYRYYIEEVKNIFRHYSDYIETDGITQFWIDLSYSKRLFGCDSFNIAKDIRKRIYKELGIKVKIGISYNQPYAKMACYVYDQSINVINKDIFLNDICSLNIDKCVAINQKDLQILKSHHIVTIADLMMKEQESIYNILGDNGKWLWHYVHGIIEKKENWDDEKVPQSIGQSLTMPYEIYTYSQAKSIIHVLIKDVIQQLNDYQLEGSTISLTLRDYEMKSITRSMDLRMYTHQMDDILWATEDLLEDLCVGSFCGHLDRPYRHMTLSITHLRDLKYAEVQDHWDHVVETVHDYIEAMNRKNQSLSSHHQFA